MAREISRAEAWERAHEVFTQVNFNAFDFNSIKESLLDYLKLYFPEDFNDYIESSEFIALLELFAYVGELLAYRIDLNAHENFITTAQRKESILRLAKLISYKASRNIPARGLVKITSVQTTESVFDTQGRNLAGRRIYWNDPNNSTWKEQFTLVINRVLEQEFGTVSPNERVQVNDVLFELYMLNNAPISSNGKSVFAYTANGYPMELVPTSLTFNGPYERRPEINAKFSILYSSDGLGDGSDTTGFLALTKQGTLNQIVRQFDGLTPNQTINIDTNNINETDVWINNVDPNTGIVLTQDPYKNVLPHLVSNDLRFGEWVEVDLANAQNILFNTNRNRHKYEIETLANDQIRIIFGDGEFSDIPSGSFHIWYRISANEDISIDRNSVVNQGATFSYVDPYGNVQTFSFTFSLIGNLQNGSKSEDAEHIRRTAPSVYYTQDRMVNHRDYNVFMMQDPSILKLRAVNRTFAGDSKYIAWHDPRENYENVKLFGNDLAMYWIEEQPIPRGGLISIDVPISVNVLIQNYIQPLLASTDLFAKISPELQRLGLNPGAVRREFKATNYSFGIDPTTGKTNELEALAQAFGAATTTTPVVDLYYSVEYDEWTVGSTTGHPCDLEPNEPPDSPIIAGCVFGPANSIWMIRVEAKFQGSELSGWDVRWRTKRLIAHSEDMKFWNTNNTLKVVDYYTLNSQKDRIVVLQANPDSSGVRILTDNLNYVVLAQELVDENIPNAGLPDIHRLSTLPEDQNNDGISDNLLQQDLLDYYTIAMWSELETGTDPADGTYHVVLPSGKTINNSTERGKDLDVIVKVNGVRKTFAAGQLIVSTTWAQDLIVDRIAFPPGQQPADDDLVEITINDYVYLTRDTIQEPWVPVIQTDEIRTLYLVEDQDNVELRLYNRYPGRYPLNFAWFHYNAQMNLIDPAASNIIDAYIITLGYYTALTRWLSNRTDVIPTAPSPLELRNTYAPMIDNKMISDTLLLHSGRFKILFGPRAIPQLRAKFKVIRPVFSSLTDNQVKVRIVDVVRNFFDINYWEFGETFFYTELAASIHANLGPEIDSVVLVPLYSQNQFGDMFQVQAREDELFIPDINTTDIEIVQAYTPENIRQIK